MTMINEDVFVQFPNLETPRLYLRVITFEDAPTMQKIRSDKNIMRYMDTFHHDSLSISKDFISKNIETYNKKQGLFWALKHKETQQMIGDFSFWRIDKKNARAEIGYTLLPDYWGKGYMSEAMVRIVKFGFNDLNLHSFEANVNPENIGSKKLLQKIGFQKEAHFKENYYYDGKFLDSEIYCLLERNFKAT